MLALLTPVPCTLYDRAVEYGENFLTLGSCHYQKGNAGYMPLEILPTTESRKHL